jgi:hypothetical protein
MTLSGELKTLPIFFVVDTAICKVGMQAIPPHFHGTMFPVGI